MKYLLGFVDFCRMVPRLWRWCVFNRPGAFFVIDTERKRIADLYHAPTDLESIRGGVWVALTSAAESGIIPVNPGAGGPQQ